MAEEKSVKENISWGEGVREFILGLWEGITYKILWLCLMTFLITLIYFDDLI
jgi:hypothetical protein